MFMGQYDQKIDIKGRTIVPAKFREEIGNQLVVARGLDKCIMGFSMSKWSELVEKLSELSITDKNVRNFIRFFLSGAATLDIDKSGRVLLPSNLRAYALLDKDATWIGAGARLEVWNPDELVKNTEFSEEDMDALADYMAGLGI